MRCYLGLERQNSKIGFVPTMGALHAGHLSLIQQARRENDIVIVSIFVNPLQFGPMEDLQQYPRTLEEDQQMCEQAGVEAIFAPSVEEMFGKTEHGSLFMDHNNEQSTIVVPPKTMSSALCGAFRPGHFQGVATIVTKLLSLIQPTNAYFGQKDAQQLAIIRRLVRDLNLPAEIVACPIVREASGLALSSRNRYLTAKQREQAAVLFLGLQQAQMAFLKGERNSICLIDAVKLQLATVRDLIVDYVELVHPMTLMPLDKVNDMGLLAIAARLGSTRLIDNVLLQERQPIVAIDGPAGAGKSTVARLVAESLGLLYLDTGAMYRALTWLVLQSGISVEDEPAIAELASLAQIHLATSEDSHSPMRVWINGEEVTLVIRSLDVTRQVSAIAAFCSVRRELVKQQQQWGKKGGVVAEGRDIGTYVFPDAELKIFLTASVQERAQRRQQDLKNQGFPDIDLENLEREISERDARDSSRAVAPLRKAMDALEIPTDGLSIAEVSELIVSLYKQKLSVSV